MAINGHITDTENNRFSQEEAKRQASKAAKDKAQYLKTITIAIAILAKMATRIALEGITNLIDKFTSFSRGQNRDGQELVDNVFDNLPGRGRSGKSKNFFQRLGNKSRGVSRGLGSKARTVRKARKAAQAAKLVKKGGKLARLAKTAKIAATVAKTAKTAKTANTAYKAYKVAKLANLGRIAATGGVALAGGPVGIGILVGSIVAPIAIEQIWKNRESIYEGGKNLVEKSKVATADIKGLIAGKNAKAGDIVPNAAGLKVQGSDKSILFEADASGKVVTNSFEPDQKLVFYQGNDRDRTMFFDEEDVYPSQEAANLPNKVSPQTNITKQADVSSIALDKSPTQQVMSNQVEATVSTQGATQQGGTKVSNEAGVEAAADISGVSIIVGTLNELSKNNSKNLQIQNQATVLKQGLTDANASEEIPLGIRDSIKIDEGGTSIISLFNSEKKSGERNQPLETEGYQISRRGNTYFLQDREGNELLKVRNSPFGTKVLSSNLNSSQMEDLVYLKEDIRLGEGITGDFMPVKSNQTQAPKSQQDFLGSALEEKEKDSFVSNSKAQNSSIFSEYLQQRDGDSVEPGNTISKSRDLER